MVNKGYNNYILLLKMQNEWWFFLKTQILRDVFILLVLKYWFNLIQFIYTNNSQDLIYTQKHIKSIQ